MSNALTHFATGGAREREQQIYTPEPIRDFLQALWPEGIQLDPCGGPDQIIQADIVLRGHRVDTGRVRKDGSSILEWEGPGLKHDWPDRTYFNPPYGDLEEWLHHDMTRSRGRTVSLVPVRCRSGWWRLWRDSLDAYIELDRVTFLGFKGSFPESLLLGYRDARECNSSEGQAALSAFYRCAAAAEIGDVYPR